MKRITRTITLEQELLDKVDKLAEETHRSRSHLFSMIVSEYFKNREVETETAGVSEE